MRLISPICLLLLAGALAAEDLYLRTGASGNNDGSDWTHAWTNCNAVSWGAGAGSVSAGDTLWVAGGSYSESLIPTSGGETNNWLVIRRVRATDNAPTNAAGWNSSYDSLVIVSNTGAGTAFSLNTLNIAFIYVDGRITNGMRLVCPNNDGAAVGIDRGCSDIVLTNLDLSGPGGSTPITMNGDNRGLDATAWNGSIFEQIDRLTVSHCNIHGEVNLMWLYNVCNSTFDHNVLYDAAALNSVTYHANVAAIAGCTNIQWRFNEVFNWQVEGLMFIFGASKDWDIYGDLWHDGIADATHRVMEVQDTVQGPFRVLNSTFAHLYYGIRSVSNSPSQVGSFAAGSGFTNCIFWAITNGSYVLPAFPTSDYNFSDGTPPGGGANSISSGSMPFTTDFSDYTIVTNIGATYPRDKGVALAAAYNLDPLGNQRGSDGSWDIGAYENQGPAAPTAPTANFTGTPVAGLTPLEVTFTDSSTGTAPLTWTWTFGAGLGTSTNQNPSFTFTNAGTNDIVLCVTNAVGGDCLTRSAYIVATNALATVANFTGTPLEGLAPLSVTFTDSSSGSPTNWLWTFGDSLGTSTNQSPSFTFTNAGTYNVQLCATNTVGGDCELKTGYVTATNAPAAGSATNSIVVITGGAVLSGGAQLKAAP